MNRLYNFVVLLLALVLLVAAQDPPGGANQGGTNQNNGNQGGTNQNNGNQGGANQNNGNQGGTNQNNGNQGNGNQGGNGASATPTTSAIPSNAPAGGITITNPVQTAEASYYKIASGVSVTFAWNFTSIVQYPSRLTVQAYCSENANTYQIGPTDLPGTATEVVWSPYEYSRSAVQNPSLPQLIQATYRLEIFDERGLGVGASPGLMSPNNRVTFALYNPQAYTPLADGWICAACSGAPSLKTIHPAFLGLLATLVVMVASGYGLVMRQLA